jgi:hypothetical protein
VFVERGHIVVADTLEEALFFSVLFLPTGNSSRSMRIELRIRRV